MSARLDGRVALVTGAASGIGLATARRLAKDGARVYTVDRSGDVDHRGDVTETGISERLISEILERHGRLDILVPCAGVTGFHTLEDHTDEFWELVMSVNVTAVFRLIRAAVPALRQSGHGRVITIGSTTGAFGGAGLVAYGTSKHAVVGLTRHIACELGPDAITVNCVMPGAVETPMTAPAFAEMPEFKHYWEKKAPLGRIAQPEDIGDVIAFLASDDARFMTGQAFFIDGGAMTAQ